MNMRFYVSRDAGAVAVGADEVALALEKAAAQSKTSIEIIRTGSRGLYWLEPMVEVATAQGRVAFGPVTIADVASVLEAASSNGKHALRLGIADEIPWLKRQTRLTFARCGVIDPRSMRLSTTELGTYPPPSAGTGVNPGGGWTVRPPG